MKRLISLSSTHGKTNEQVAKEVFELVQKYKKVEQQALPPKLPEPEETDWHKMAREFNQKAKEEGKLAKGTELGVTQIIFFRKTPQYPKKGDK